MMTGSIIHGAFFGVAWIGHACVCTAIISCLYGMPINKRVLKTLRLATGIAILAFPFTVIADLPLYPMCCAVMGAIVLPSVTILRALRSKPAAVLEEHTETIDFHARLGSLVRGDGKYRFLSRLPLNCIFRVDFTHLTLAPEKLPESWDGLSILFLSDFHFCGTPSREFFSAVLAKIAEYPVPDLILFGGDFVDGWEFHSWIAPLLGELKAIEGKFAVLGNHDVLFDPERVRKHVESAGITVLGNGCVEHAIREERCILIGNESPWIRPRPDLSAVHKDAFRLCIAHSPDNFYWGIRNRISLMVCGHTHGGQIRVPLIGSIFVPSVYGRRFDQGVFAAHGTTMVVSRGISGREPIRFRCNPQVIHMTLKKK